ncbi:MAG TPA: tRNA pseudouridine(38-40) synthase TruA [Clostridiales bacterium]|nr:tRNA pseudouridine(38-40) synthase TruA [Clostridiales bacterium]
MKRIMLKIAYDGTNYCGWQIQPNQTSVEGKLNEVISKLLNEEITVIGASRTDSGVHALGNVAVFDTKTIIPSNKIMYVLNQKLPDDIKIKETHEVDKSFHPRAVKSIKTYEYRILNSKVFLPQERYFSHMVYKRLDIDKMKKAAEYLCGEHDFTSFSSIKTEVKSKVRKIYKIEIDECGPYEMKNDGYESRLIKIRIVGNGFLYNMVRIIVGTLINVGIGSYPPERIVEILAGKNRKLAGSTAPAKGLTLIGIEY